MRRTLLILGFAWAALFLADAAEAKRCRCAHGIVHTSRSCGEACGRVSRKGNVRREAERSTKRHDSQAERTARKAKKARAAAGRDDPRRSGFGQPYLYHGRGRHEPPKQEGLTNIEERPLPTSLGDGVFCSEGEVILPKRPTREMREFCRRQ